MTSEEKLRLNQITEDSEILKSTLLLIGRLKEIDNQPPYHPDSKDDFRKVIRMLATLSSDISDRLHKLI